MEKWRGRFKQWASKQFHLPEDVLLELPRITTVGQIHAYIENHKGLVTFTDRELVVKMSNGYVKIHGENFVLKTMLKEEIIVEGKIMDIQYMNH
ncbi:sporulation protein YqfC [Salirhabdus salicampi]|uniref:sporulation protein YqfC n=1 Tax=Salirhabdus salicampi TaxID=476102 RepID=UPI0020C49A8F|nr:sporulation protein YqfC [Salirhabdus salicampi]MCP8616902.1 sporulation protein YqfC [Salirhabdus salicampi]